MNSITIATCIFLSFLCLFLPRRYVLLPFIAAACLIPMNQRFYIFGLDFTVLRVLVLTGMLRLVVRGELEAIHWNTLDKMVLAWSLSNTIFNTLLWGTLAAFINRCGLMFDSLGLYFLYRHFFRNFENIHQAIKLFAFCAIISAPLVAIERHNHSSPFAIFGPTGATFHRGRFRCAGPFPHFIMMGVFWASMLPLFYSSWKRELNRLYMLLAIGSALFLVFLSASSTPLMTIGAMVLFWKLYMYRQYGKRIFLGACGMILLLHIVMKAPVWHLLARANIFGGSTGWHRFNLFDQFVKRIPEWFFFGTKSTGHWGHDLFDVTNQFVLEAVRGGATTLFIFIFLLYYAIKVSGKGSLVFIDKSYRWFAWGVCISLLGHMVTFWGTSYFGQILMVFFMHLAMASFIEDNIEHSSVYISK